MHMLTCNATRQPCCVRNHPPCRRSLLADAPIVVTFSLQSDDGAAVAQALAAAARDGTLDELLALLGGRLGGYIIIDGQVGCSLVTLNMLWNVEVGIRAL